MIAIRVAITLAAALSCLMPGRAHDATRPTEERLCPMLKAAIEIGTRDNSFAALRSLPLGERDDESVSATRAIEGFDCSVAKRAGPIGPIIGNSIEGTTGFYSCSRYDYGKGGGIAAAEKLAAEVSNCLGVVPQRSDYKHIASYTFTVSDHPFMIVFITPNGLKYEGVILNLLAE